MTAFEAAKQRYTAAVIAALRGDPGAERLCEEALRQLNEARGALAQRQRPQQQRQVRR